MTREEFEALKVGDVFTVGVDKAAHTVGEVESYVPEQGVRKNHSITTTKGYRMKVGDILVGFMTLVKKGE